ncbi:MAG: flagellar protein FlgN [Deltaproteobacteria bacterium]
MELKLLIGHLSKETELFKEFVSVLQKETENLVGRDYKGLYETISRKEHLLIRFEVLSSARQELMQAAAKSLGIAGDVNLSRIIEMSGGVDRAEIKRLQTTILTLLDSIREINKLNSLVVKESIENINKTLGMLANFMPAGTYSQSGSYQGIAVKGSRLSEGA